MKKLSALKEHAVETWKPFRNAPVIGVVAIVSSIVAACLIVLVGSEFVARHMNLTRIYIWIPVLVGATLFRGFMAAWACLVVSVVAWLDQREGISK